MLEAVSIEIKLGKGARTLIIFKTSFKKKFSESFSVSLRIVVLTLQTDN